MANTERTRKLLVRTALVTSTTIATLLGAQNLAMLDARQLELTTTPATTNAVVVTTEPLATPVTVLHAAPALEIQQVAPSITILRQSGQVAPVNPVMTTTTTTNTAIQPPVPVGMAAPQPVIVQQSVLQHSQSSR